MRNFFLFVLTVFFVGCASSTPNISVKTSDPIFFTLSEANKSVYVNFKNSATGQDVNAEILIADEPTGNLDEANERIILDLFCKLRKEGKTILLVTHNPDLGEYGDKIVYLRHGKLENIRTIENPKVPNAI